MFQRAVTYSSEGSKKMEEDIHLNALKVQYGSFGSCRVTGIAEATGMVTYPGALVSAWLLTDFPTVVHP